MFSSQSYQSNFLKSKSPLKLPMLKKWRLLREPSATSAIWPTSSAARFTNNPTADRHTRRIQAAYADMRSIAGTRRGRCERFNYWRISSETAEAAIDQMTDVDKAAGHLVGRTMAPSSLHLNGRRVSSSSIPFRSMEQSSYLTGSQRTRRSRSLMNRPPAMHIVKLIVSTVFHRSAPMLACKPGLPKVGLGLDF